MTLLCLNFSITGAVVGITFNESLSNIFPIIFFLIGGAFIIAGGIENKIIGSRIKDSSLLLKVAKDIGKKGAISRDVSHLISELNKGNTSPGVGTKTVSRGIYELRGRNGGRVYYREADKSKYEILGYSDKSSQRKVINYIKNIYN